MNQQQQPYHQPVAPHRGGGISTLIGVIFAFMLFGLLMVGIVEAHQAVAKAGVILAYIAMVVAPMAGIACLAYPAWHRWLVDQKLRRHADLDIQAKEKQILRDQEEHEARIYLAKSRLQPDPIGNYPVPFDPDTHEVTPVPRGNVVQPVPHHWAPHEQYEYKDTSTRVREEEQAQIGPGAEMALPTFVRYEEVKPRVPRNHALVGISERGIETREEGQVKPCIWIVGGSGTGKTNSTTIRVDEDYEYGYGFLPIDPHKFKPDSLSNAIPEYAPAFLRPVTQSLEEIDATLDAFLDEFERRKNNGPWTQRWRILIDEIGSLTADIDPKNELEVHVARKIKEGVRICGQEARDFGMGGIFCSQDAAGLAWLRKRALMVIAHQVLMMSERLLVCNQNSEMARAMDTWPIGRTLIYGIGFREGHRVFQQPLFTPRIVDTLPAHKQLGTRPVPSGTPDFKPVEPDVSGTDKSAFFAEKDMRSGTLIPPLDPPLVLAEQGTEEVPAGTDEKRFSIEQEAEFIRRYKACGSIKESLRQMHLGYGRYQRYASFLVHSRKLRKA